MRLSYYCWHNHYLGARILLDSQKYTHWYILILLAVQVDQMVIHSASDPRPRTTLCGDYFYNYFTRGLDILFDGQVLMSFSIPLSLCGF